MQLNVVRVCSCLRPSPKKTVSIYLGSATVGAVLWHAGQTTPPGFTFLFPKLLFVHEALPCRYRYAFKFHGGLCVTFGGEGGTQCRQGPCHPGAAIKGV